MRGWARVRAWMVCVVIVVSIAGMTSPRGVSAAQTQLPTTEWNALVALYDATDGPNWTTPWDLTTETPCDSLPGVECVGCNLGACHVDGLRLNWFDLSGELPAELADLSHLTTLSLRGNQLTGAISAAVTGLTNLQVLDLGDNDLSGAIPPALADLSGLAYIQLYGNALTGTIPPGLGALSSLSQLDLASNQLTGEIPDELGDLNLWTLNLGGNHLTGEIPAELGNLSGLRGLFLFENQLSGEIPNELANLTNLSTLSLGENDLTGQIPAWLGSLSNLSLIGLDSNHFSGPIPPELGNLSNLYWLELANNQLVGPIPPELANLTRIANPAPDATVILSLGYNMLWAESDALDAFLAHDPYWESSQVVPPRDVQATPLGGGVQLTWTSPLQLGYYPGYLEVGISTTAGGPYTTALQIEEYDATEARVSGLPPETTYYLAVRVYGPAGGQQLNDLLSPWSDEMTVTTLPGQSELPDAEFAALEALYAAAGGDDWTVGWTLPTSTPCKAGVLPGVTCAGGHVVGLSLANNGLSGTIPPQLGDLAMLEVLNLRGNALTGAIPPGLGGLTNLLYLYLDGNRLSGSIPLAFGDLSALRRLSLGGNQLTGPIPAELGALGNLYWLTVNDNRLGGALPSELANLTGITVLDLGYNALWAEGDALADLLAADPDWTETQAAPPANLRVTPVPGGAALTWTPIALRTPGTYYEVGFSTRAGGPYSAILRTASATETGATLTDVLPYTTCYLAVRTYSPASQERPYDLLSPYGREVVLMRAAFPFVAR